MKRHKTLREDRWFINIILISTLSHLKRGAMFVQANAGLEPLKRCSASQFSRVQQRLRLKNSSYLKCGHGKNERPALGFFANKAASSCTFPKDLIQRKNHRFQQKYIRAEIIDAKVDSQTFFNCMVSFKLPDLVELPEI